MGFEFPVIRLGDHVEKIGSGATPRGGSNVYQNTGIALIRSQNVYNNMFSYGGLAFISAEHAQQLQSVEVKEGDVLLNITGDSVARACQVPADVLPARVNQHVAIIRTRKECLDPRFLLYYLTSPQMQNYMLTLAAAGGTRNALTKGMIENFYIPAPDIQEQRKIAHILGTLDDKIELNRRMNATLEASARAVFKSWFVDFDPVHAKAHGEQPYGMNAETVALFPDAFEDSELGPIPAGWGVKTVGDKFNVTMGQSPRGETYNEDGVGVPFYQGRRDFGFRYPALRVYCTAPTRLASAGDTLVSVRAPVGDLNMALQDCSIGRGIAAVRHKSGARSYTYYAVASLSAHFERFEAEGTVFGSLSGKDFRNLAFLAPPDEVVQKFEALAIAIDSMIETNERQSPTLVELRNTLLPRLLSGKVHLTDIENHD